MFVTTPDDYQHGAIASLGFAFGRLMRPQREQAASIPDFKPHYTACYINAMELVVAQLGSQHMLLKSAGLATISIFFRFTFCKLHAI